jgi:ubiquinone/menaquinone biosynthesis C-methylase UbiE
MNREEYDSMYRLEDSHWWFVARRNLLFRSLKRLLDARNNAHPIILDVGCGTGGTLDRMRPLGDVVGLDLEPLALDFCRERGWHTLVNGSATALPFPDDTFDAAVALDVLEHIPDHHTAAREIARVLQPGGVLLATVPAYQSLWSRHDVALMHQRRYLAPEFGALLTAAGLEVEYLTYTVAALLPLVYLIRRAQRFFQPNATPRADAAHVAPLVNRALLALLDAESRLNLNGTHLPFGLTVFAIARKSAH